MTVKALTGRLLRLILCALMLSPGPALAVPAPQFPVHLFESNHILYVLAPKIQCRGPNGGGHGTGVRITSELVLTAAHVALVGNCTINGEPITPEYIDPSLDFAVMRTPNHGQPGWSRISCEEPVRGKVYRALGHARHGPLRDMFVVGLGRIPADNGGFSRAGAFWNDVEAFIPGMSGGPVQNERLDIVGIVIGYNRVAPVSFARMLVDTPICASR